jgi:hypothetical protein
MELDSRATTRFTVHAAQKSQAKNSRARIGWNVDRLALRVCSPSLKARCSAATLRIYGERIYTDS